MTLNPSIKTLILKYNNFHSVDASFNFYPDLELVDLSSNQLVSIPDRSFSSQRRLKELRIENNKISSLNEKTFTGLSKLQVLNLGHNLIDKLSNRVLKPLKHVKEIIIKQNRISEIESEAFIGLTELTVLDLSDNLLESVPSEAFKHLENLAELNLGKNNFRVLPDSSFSQLLKMSSLDLSGNKIERIHEKAFLQLKSLNELNLNDNELYQVPSHTFKTFDKLEILHIGQNKFSAIDGDSFLDLDKLRELYITGSSHLVEVGAGTFVHLDLEKIILSSNRNLKYIDSQAFGSSSVNLKTVDLSNNGFSSVSSSLLSWSSLSSVDMSGNPWTCDCDLSFLKSVIVSAVNKSDTVRVVRCWNPPNLRERDITSLDMDCSLVHSPTTQEEKKSSSMNNTELIAIICSSAVVISVILVTLILKSRKKIQSCFNSSIHGSPKSSSSSGKMLQYSPYQHEPRYVSYQVVQTLHRPNTGPGTVIVNPHTESLVRQENYFMTLKDHEKLHYLSDLESEYAQARARQQQVALVADYPPEYGHHVGVSGVSLTRARQYPANDSIYQRVDTDDPVSDI